MRAAVFAAAIGVFLATPALANGNASLGELRAFLFYKESGTLSKNLLGRNPEFAGWNTIIGGGDAKGPADDLLVVVTIVAPTETFDKQHPPELWVTNEHGKVVAQRTFHGVLVSANGETSNPLWLSGIGCAGELSLHARFRGKEKSARVVLACGE